MELKNITTFVKTAELMSFSETAEQIGYSQSAITFQIQQLEKELGVQLFDRVGHRVVLSAAGKEFLPYARKVLKAKEQAENCFRDENSTRGELRIGIMECLCASKYSEIIPAYEEKCPNVHVKICIGKTYEVMDMLDKGQLDLIVTLDDRQIRADWETLVSIPTEIDLICARNHFKAGNHILKLQDLSDERYIMVEKGCNYRAAFEKIMQEKGMFPECVLEIGHTRTILNVVEQDIGITVLPAFVLEEQDYEKLTVLRPADYNMTMEIQVIVRRDRWHSPALNEFVKFWNEYQTKL